MSTSPTNRPPIQETETVDQPETATSTAPDRPEADGAGSVDRTETTSGMSPNRREKFEADIAQVRVKTGSTAAENRMITVGIGLMAVGAVVALVAFVLSGSQSDSRDVISSVIAATFGLCLVVAGAAVFLRYSIGRFLRFWLLRLIYEQQS